MKNLYTAIYMSDKYKIFRKNHDVIYELSFPIINDSLRTASIIPKKYSTTKYMVCSTNRSWDTSLKIKYWYQ